MNQTRKGAQPDIPSSRPTKLPATTPILPVRHLPDSGDGPYVRIATLAAAHPDIETEGKFRNRMHKAETAKRAGTATADQLGFLRCVVRREGRRQIVVDYPKYIQWLTGQQSEGGQ
jgi:hypothetical protein